MSSLAFAIVVAPGCNPGCTTEWCARLALAAAIRGAECAASWTGAVDGLDVAPPSVRVLPSSKGSAPDEIIVLLQPTIDQPDASAYHSVDGSKPFALVLADPGTSLDEIAIATIHEILETIVDPTCDGYAHGVAREVADPVQGVPQPVLLADGGDPVAAEAYVTPTWFGLRSGGATTSTGLALGRGMIAPGGYAIEQDGSEVFGTPGMKLPSSKLGPHGRRARRARARRRATP